MKQLQKQLGSSKVRMTTYYSESKPINAKDGDMWFRIIDAGTSQIHSNKYEIYEYAKGEWCLVHIMTSFGSGGSYVI